MEQICGKDNNSTNNNYLLGKIFHGFLNHYGILFDYTKYLIVRIGLNEDYTVQNIVVLETNDGITFNSRNVEGYCYRFREFNHEDEAIFYRTVQKLKQK